MTVSPASLLCGIFIGGKSRRMAGHPKGLLPAPPVADAPATQQPSLVARLISLLHSHRLAVVLVGQQPDYAHLGLPMLADQPPGRGPLGGLSALLLSAQERGDSGVIALSCDLPFFGSGLLSRLLHAEASAYDAVAPRWTPADRSEPLWEPLCARYALSFLPLLQTALGSDARSLQDLLSQARTLPLDLAADEQAEVKDWDSPADLPSSFQGVWPRRLLR